MRNCFYSGWSSNREWWILIVKVASGQASLLQDHSPQAGLPQGVMDTVHSQGLSLPKLVIADQCMGHGLQSRTCHKPKLRISPDQQRRGWCSSHPECLFQGEAPVSHWAWVLPCPHRVQASLFTGHKAPEPEVWGRLLDAVSLLDPCTWLRKPCAVGTKKLPVFVNELPTDKHVSCHPWFMFSGHPLMVTLQAQKTENYYVKLLQ